ncbi:hypothetical protein QTP86_010438 [Hemibagrus guttatus]|nr:hypothetical protein QTP86_010438 [Hemibagrus guttatus]
MLLYQVTFATKYVYNNNLVTYVDSRETTEREGQHLTCKTQKEREREKQVEKLCLFGANLGNWERYKKGLCLLYGKNLKKGSEAIPLVLELKGKQEAIGPSCTGTERGSIAEQGYQHLTAPKSLVRFLSSGLTGTRAMTLVLELKEICHPSIHPSIHSLHSSFYWVMGNLQENLQETRGNKAGSCILKVFCHPSIFCQGPIFPRSRTGKSFGWVRYVMIKFRSRKIVSASQMARQALMAENGDTVVLWALMSDVRKRSAPQEVHTEEASEGIEYSMMIQVLLRFVLTPRVRRRPDARSLSASQGQSSIEINKQYGFMPRKSTTDAIFALRILMEKYRDGQKELHCVFVDLEKAYDRVPREELWYCMRKSGVAEKYVRVVQDMYERSRTVVRCAVGQTEEFNVEVGLHQGSALSPFLFAIVMDQLSEEVIQESPWTMMFADDIVICSERWRFALERRGMKVSRSKTEYMCVNEREGSGTVRLQGEEVKKVQEFKYLGSTVQSNGECGKEVKKRVQAGWNGWRKVSGVLCDQKISARIKGKVYRTVVRPAMLYGLETVSLRKRQESELEVAELKMLRFSLGVTRLDRIRNEYIRGTAHVGRLGDKVREARLRWFGHVQRRESKLSQCESLYCQSETVLCECESIFGVWLREKRKFPAPPSPHRIDSGVPQAPGSAQTHLFKDANGSRVGA